MLKLKLENQIQNYCEIGQQIDFKLALCTKEGNTVTSLHVPIKCRDFLNEGIVGQHIKWGYSPIYGYSLDPNKWPIDLSKAELLIYIGKSASKHFRDNFDLLLSTEKEYGFELSEIHAVEPPQGIDKDLFYIKGDKRWFSSTLYISTYTYLLRMMAMKTPPTKWKGASIDDFIEYIAEEGNGNDSIYASAQKNSKVKISNLLEHFNSINEDANEIGTNITADPKKFNVADLHNNGGLQSFIKKLEKVRGGDKYPANQILGQQVNNYYQHVDTNT